MYQQQSYDNHAGWYNRHFPTREAKVNFLKVKSTKENNIAQWLQQLFFKCLDPLLNEPFQQWLTVGDAYGFDAQYILQKGSHALATDLNTNFLEVARDEHIIREYAAENAEKLSFGDAAFDYVLCKESYHHFPRPYAALYEMMRVARKGIVIMEPQDPVLKMPLLLWLSNVLTTKSRTLNKIWKNRFSFEPVGNFVYKVSEREFEKFAAGLNLPLVAFKRINPNFHFQGADDVPAHLGNSIFFAIRAKKLMLDILMKLKLIPGQVLSAIVFKQQPDEQTMQQLRADGYRLVVIPDNPYIK
ncbi:MAG: class I SAM-dependent methyltransferase [Mucilaginibacter sp.]|uniref:class I SAM-dependent methyltransferase n=1 Tax=Mucilaginibacter sp. TaxID=1882438 RepID=UPI0031B4D0F9